MRMSIPRTVALFGVCVLAGLLAVVAASTLGLRELKVGGPVYVKIIAGKDLVADILPPPLYIVEPYLEAQLLVDDPAAVDAHAAELARMRKDFDARQAYWLTADIPPDLKDLLTVQSHIEAMRFWNVVEGELLPAVRAGDKAREAAAMAEATDAYRAHRAVVEKAVARANAFSADQERSEKGIEAQVYLILTLFSLLVVVMVIGVNYLMTRNVSRPIKAISHYMGRLAAGDYQAPPPFTNAGGEVGQMARAVAVFRDAAEERRIAREAQEAERETAQRQKDEAARRERQVQEERERIVAQLAGGLGALAEGDLSRRIDQPFPPEYEALRADFNKAVNRLRDLIGAITESTSTVRSGAGEIAAAADDLSRRTEQQASTLEETAAALEQVTVTVAQSTDRADQAMEAVQTAKTQAEGSEDVVASAVTAMRQIETSAGQITSIISVIDEIAFQTNLLALNAGVEAARAGEAGKGFAVVASEVRALAQRSADAAKEIKELISTSAREVEQGVALVGRTGEALTAIVGHVVRIDSLIHQIAVGAREQSGALREINVAVSQLDQATQHNAGMVEQTTAASHHLSSEAAALDEKVGQFKMDATSAAEPIFDAAE